ncbi:MAG: hypothetical protein AABY22_26270, partial [Nanoarchaeota archaeon]
MVEIKAKLVEISGKISLPIETVERDYNNLLQQLGDEKKAYYKLVMMYKLSRQSKEFVGIIIGSSTPFDQNSGLRKTALQKLKDDRDSAILNKYIVVQDKTDPNTGEVTKVDVPADFREIFKNGKPNILYGKPLRRRVVK